MTHAGSSGVRALHTALVIRKTEWFNSEAISLSINSHLNVSIIHSQPTSPSILFALFHNLLACLTLTVPNKLTDWFGLFEAKSLSQTTIRTVTSQLQQWRPPQLHKALLSGWSILVGGQAKNTTGTCCYWLNKLELMGGHSAVPHTHIHTYVPYTHTYTDTH